MKKLISLLLACVMLFGLTLQLVPAASAAYGFYDVSAKAFYAQPVGWAVAKEITKGTGTGRFSPNQACTRGQVVTFLWRAKGEPEPKTTKCPFDDVHKKDFYYKAVLWAVEEGITKGTNPGKFSPNQSCTRGQVVTFLWRTEGEPAPSAGSTGFGDIKTRDFFYKAVLWAVEHGITTGTGKGKFSPGQVCTRGQIVTFLFRALGDPSEVPEEEDYPDLVSDAYNQKFTIQIPYSTNTKACQYSIPKVNLESSSIAAFNQKLYKTWTDKIGLTINPGNEWHATLLGLSYTWYASGDYLTFQIHEDWYEEGYDRDDYYTILISDRKVPTKDELLAAYGMSPQAYAELAKKALASAFLDKNYEDRQSFSSDENFREFFEKTISPDHVDQAVPFIDKDGHLNIYGFICMPVQSGGFHQVIDLKDFVLSPHYAEMLQPPAQTVTPSEDVYKNFLLNKEYRNNEYRYNFVAYWRFDLNKDGADDLVMHGYSMYDVYTVYAYDSGSGKLVEAGSFEAMGGMKFSPSSGTLSGYWRDMNNGDFLYSYSIFQLDGAKLKSVIYFTYSTGSGQYTNNSTGRKMSEAEVGKYLADAYSPKFTPL